MFAQALATRQQTPAELIETAVHLITVQADIAAVTVCGLARIRPGAGFVGVVMIKAGEVEFMLSAETARRVYGRLMADAPMARPPVRSALYACATRILCALDAAQVALEALAGGRPADG